MSSHKPSKEAEQLLRDFDWSKVDALTDAQIVAAAQADPDSSLPTDEELARFDLVIPAKARREKQGHKVIPAKARREKQGHKPPKEAAE